MELDFLWSYQSDWKLKLLVLAIIAQILLTIWLYMQMAKARFAAVNKGEATREDYTVINEEPAASRIQARALENQFELPVLFYATVITGMAIGASSWITVLLAFGFIILRIIHAREMVGENRVMKRRGIFINAMCVFILMVVELFISTLFFI